MSEEVNVMARSWVELPEQNPTQRFSNPVPAEGEHGVFSESWFPICLSEEIRPGELRGESFLGGRVVAYRGEDGVARVVSAYCPHLGADLSVGCVLGNRLQCAFHQWEYDAQGACVKTAVGDSPPTNARLFKFPTAEHYGVIWAFNGNRPHWSLPTFERPPEHLRFKCYRWPELFHCDPWVFAANTPDMQHIKVVHKAQFSRPDPHDLVQWDEWGFTYKIIADHQNDVPIEWQVGIRGTSVFWQQGPYGDFWLGGMVGFGLPEAGKHAVFAILAVDAEQADRESQVGERFNVAEQLMRRTVNEDKDILNTIHYRPGTMTRGDQTLAKYLRFLRDYPRSHPSEPFIN